jgi:hypothetical protein
VGTAKYVGLVFCLVELTALFHQNIRQMYKMSQFRDVPSRLSTHFEREVDAIFGRDLPL